MQSLPHYKTVKCPLKGIIKDPDKQETIELTVLKVHKIITQLMQFTKLYLLWCFETNKIFPELNRDFFTTVVRTITTGKRGTVTKNIELLNDIELFYNEHCTDLFLKDVDNLKTKDIIHYAITGIITDYENNVKQRLYNYVKKYIETCFYKKEHYDLISQIKGRRACNRFLVKRIDKVVHDLLTVNTDDYKSDQIFHDWINSQKKILFLNKTKFEKDTVMYDLKVKPQEYLYAMIFMSKTIEIRGHKVMEPCPFRTSIQPRYIRLDTASLISLFVEKKKDLQAISVCKDLVWDQFFKTGKEIFKDKNYDFDCMIETDGFGASVILKRKDLPKKRWSKKPKVVETPELYIDDLNQETLIELRTKKIVGIDPNKADLIYCCSKEPNQDQTQKTFRYTQNQRKVESGRKKHRKILLSEKTEVVKETELQLSKFRHKTVDFERFKNFVREKNSLFNKLHDFYSRLLFRKQRLSTYTKTKQSEQKMVRAFKQKFGGPGETVIGFGDWEQKKTMKFQEPTKGKGFRTLFRKAGYKVYLVDEFRTSKRCCKCKSNDSDCEKFLIKDNPRPWKNDTNVCHGLVKCKTCKTMFNRDINASCNILEIITSTINGRDRPEYLARTFIATP